MADTTSTTPDGVPEGGGSGAQDTPDASGAAPQDAKARFREALDRKNNAAHRSAEGRQETGGVQGSEVTGGKRSFRRKTG